MSEYLTLAEAAKFLRCSKQKLYSDAYKNGAHRYPIYRDGGKILYLQSELDAIIQSHRVATSQELQADAERVVNGK